MNEASSTNSSSDKKGTKRKLSTETPECDGSSIIPTKIARTEPYPAKYELNGIPMVYTGYLIEF